jgi:ketosteroid isomerase-like protein
MSTSEINKEVVSRYFSAVGRGDMAAIVDILDDRVSFWVPPSLPDGVEYHGKEAVLRLFSESVGLYDADAGLSVEIKHLTADEDRVAAELVIRGKSAADGAAYENWYHFLFRLHAGRIVEIREHLDSLYAYRKLFEPAGITERSQIEWLPRSA